MTELSTSFTPFTSHVNHLLTEYSHADLNIDVGLYYYDGTDANIPDLPNCRLYLDASSAQGYAALPAKEEYHPITVPDRNTTYLHVSSLLENAPERLPAQLKQYLHLAQLIACDYEAYKDLQPA